MFKMNILTKKIFLSSKLEIQLLFTTKLKRVKSPEHSFLKVLSFKLKERAKQRPLQLEKCPAPLGLKEYSQ